MSLFAEMEDDLADEDLAEHAAEKPVAHSGAGLLPPRQSALCLGHDEIEKTLLGLYAQGRLPHALIFTGPEGIGKSTMAFRFAKKLLKDEKLVSSGGHPDLIFIERQMDEKKGRRKGGVEVEEIRRIPPFMRMTASYGGWRITIVDDADTMTRSAQNALLKILEEPPAQALLILIAHKMGTMAPTIRSRARVFTFNALEKSDFRDLLRREHPQLTDVDMTTLQAITGGSIGQAVRLMEEGGLEPVYKIVGLLNGWPNWDWLQIHGLADNLSKPGQEDAFQSCERVLLWAVSALTQAKARNAAPPPPLDTEAIRAMLARYSLEEWSGICENLKEHLEAARFANLDKKQAVLGAFAILSPQEKR